MNHRHHREEHHQQRRERQRLLKGVADLVLLDHSAERGREHDYGEPDHADLSQMGAERNHEEHRDQRLNQDLRAVVVSAAPILLGGKVGQHLAHPIGQPRTKAKGPGHLEQYAGE